jgi:putative membrane protein
MKIIVTAMTAFVAVEHIGILVLEMFFWNHPVGQRIFGMTPDASATSAKT